ncbi:MAG TPA: hypothetical protein VF188_00085 [Longimicrobiales bacterium]
MGQPVDKDDLRDTRDTILEEMRAGFAGIHQRQDVTNGRVNAGEIQGAMHGTKIRHLEAEIFNRRAGDRRVSSDPEQRGITRRDVQMVLAGASGLGAAVMFLWKVLPFLLKAL